MNRTALIFAAMAFTSVAVVAAVSQADDIQQVQEPIYSLGVVSAQPVDPGATIDLWAGGAICDTSTSTRPAEKCCDPPLYFTVFTECDEVAGTGGTWATLSAVQPAAAQAIASLTYGFEVSADTDTAGNMIPVRVAYDIAWSGIKEAISGVASVAIDLNVYDVTDSANPVQVASVAVHSDSLTGGGAVDVSNAMDVLDLTLIRGNVYAVVIEMEALAELLDWVNFEEDHGSTYEITVIALSATVGVDLLELAEQVAQNTEDIANNAADIAQTKLAIAANSEDIEASLELILANTAAIEALAAAVAELQEILEDLGDEFSTHTHTYLTGKAVGQNNTEATTTGPVSPPQ